AGLLATLLFAGNSYVLTWYPLLKTFALSTLLLFTAYLCICEVRSRRGLFLGGLFLALTIDTRLYLAATLPVFLLCIFARKVHFPKLRTAYLWFGVGLTTGLVLNLVWLVSDPMVFYFNNLGFHAMRAESGLFIGSFHQKAAMMLKVFGLYPSAEASGVPF